MSTSNVIALCVLVGFVSFSLGFAIMAAMASRGHDARYEDNMRNNGRGDT